MIVAHRAQHVASVLADALGRPLAGMSDDSGLSGLTLAADTDVWVRL